MLNVPAITPVEERLVTRANVPYLIEIEPQAQVAAGANAVVRQVVGPRDFVCTGFGFTSEPVGVPAAGQYFKISIEDIGGATRFSPARFHVTPVIGTNPGVGDQSPFEFPKDAPWTFTSLTTIEVVFENLGALPCTPTLVLIGYLT